MKTTLIVIVLVAAVCRKGVRICRLGEAAGHKGPRTPMPMEVLQMSKWNMENINDERVVYVSKSDDPICLNTPLSCNDCTSVTQCAYVGNRWSYLQTYSCPDNAPFCQNGECVKYKEDTQGCQLPPVSTKFECLEGFDGYYPSPDDCTKYYVCSKGVAYVYNCPAEYMFSLARRMCVRRDTDDKACYVFRCHPGEVSYQLYEPEKSVYAFCTGKKAAVRRCQSRNYRMDPADPYQPCAPFCSEQGRFADADDPRKYYECNLVPINRRVPDCTHCTEPGTLTDPIPQYCPPDTVFSRQLRECVEPDNPFPL